MAPAGPADDGRHGRAHVLRPPEGGFFVVRMSKQRTGEAARMNYLIVFLGAGLGGAGRHGVNVLAARLVGTAFPAGTLVINVLGCLLMGLIAGAFALRVNLPQEARLFLTTGILGGFTTFSAFSLDAALLWQRGEAGLAALYVGASVIFSLLAVAAGLALARIMLAGGAL
jgi:CrcB protein